MRCRIDEDVSKVAGGMKRLSKVSQTLKDKLQTFYNDRNFIVGVMSNAKDEEDRKVIIDFMDNGDEVTVENIILLSLELGNERGNE